jgi:aldehyde dehydrogenase (NAD+)
LDCPTTSFQRVGQGDLVSVSATESTTPPSREVWSLLGGAGAFVNGRWIAGKGSELRVMNPATEEVLLELPETLPEDVDAAVLAARHAFDDGPWPRLSPSERSAALMRLVEGLDAHRDQLAELGVLEVGTPIALSRQLHADFPIRCFEYWAEMAVAGPRGRWQRFLPLDQSASIPTMSILLSEPAGVVAAIAAYNYPLLISAFKVGGALAAGCTAVLMPSPRTPLSALALLRIAEEAEFPAGVLNLVLGEAEVGQRLTTHRCVDVITFTGSVGIGRDVMHQAASGLKRVVLELGGKSPNLLLPSADIDLAVGPSILRFTRNSGQGCGATTRILVPANSLDSFVERAQAFLDDLVVDDPWKEETDLGPLIRAEHLERVQAYVARALSTGGEVVAGGGATGLERGWFMRPVLIGGVKNDSELCQDEIFGPVAAVVPYDSVDQAVELANATRFGLNANIWGQTDDALRIATRLRSGTVTLNGGGPERPDAPWGGYGESGVGYDRGEDGFSEFLQTKHVQWPLSG